jgi:hypothetical protein
MSFTIGADPELFFVNKDSKFISIVGLIGGTKEEPMPIGNGCAIQEDNVAAEFCIPACTSEEMFIQSIQYSLNDINLRAEKLGLSLATLVASTSFDVDQLRTRKAQEFGCEPDFNAYTKKTNPRPRAKDKTLRSAGGHVHVGTDLNQIDIIRTMDLYLGVPSLLVDNDEQRRQLYGKAGSFRPKPYGVEYRTLSNFWIWDTSTIKWVYHQVSTCLDKCANFISSTTEQEQKEIELCINTNNKEQALSLVNKWNICLPS